MKVKVYVVQKADKDGIVSPDILAIKLTFVHAHELAKLHAPAKVTAIDADKTLTLNGPGCELTPHAMQLIARRQTAR